MHSRLDWIQDPNFGSLFHSFTSESASSITSFSLSDSEASILAQNRSESYSPPFPMHVKPIDDELPNGFKMDLLWYSQDHANVSYNQAVLIWFSFSVYRSKVQPVPGIVITYHYCDFMDVKSLSPNSIMLDLRVEIARHAVIEKCCKVLISDIFQNQCS